MEFIDEIINLLEEGKFYEVINSITEFLNENEEYKTIDYFHFANPIEELLYSVYFGDFDSIKKLDFDKPLEEVYMFYAIAYKEVNQIDNAEKFLKIANKINPVSSIILMNLCEIYQAKHEEHRLKGLSLDIMKYTYDAALLVSSYFKLADYYYHTHEDLEKYDHLFNLFIALKGEEGMDVSKDIKYLESHDVPVGFNPEFPQILMYLIDVFSKQGMQGSVEYFKNIFNEIVGFTQFLNGLR